MLTNDEISDIYEEPSKTPREFARSIESAVLAKLREQEPVGYLHPEKEKAISISDLNDQQLWTQAMWKTGKPLYLHPAPIPEDWISVKDRLPENGESTFIYARPNDRGGFSVGIGYRAVNGTYRTETGATETRMSHWRPLPAQPMAAARSE